MAADPAKADFGLLRPMTDADLGVVLAWRNHPAIRTHMYTQHEITLEEHQAWWERVKRSSKYAMFIFEKDGEPLGYVAFSDITPRSGTATWAFYARPDAPRGIGSQMEYLALEEAFGGLGLRKLNCEVIEQNQRVLRLHEGFGFVREGLFRAHVLIDEALDDVHRLALFADDWAGLRGAKLQSIMERVSK